MGRTLKRVALDFSYPMKKVWEGYLNPFWKQKLECLRCDGSGYGPEAKIFSDQWYGTCVSDPFDPVAYGATPLTVLHPKIVEMAERNVRQSPAFYAGIADLYQVAWEANRLLDHFKNQWCHHLIQADVDALVAAGRLMDFTRRPRTPEQEQELKETGGYWLKQDNGYIPTADEVNAWSIGGMSHDAINRSVCIEARCAREGVVYLCPTCEGDGYLWPSKKIEEAYEAWRPTEPPAGDGYQLWETTSEGSPVSPVFETLGELCEWCSGNATTFGSCTATAAEWRQMLDQDNVHHREGNMIFL